MLNFKSSNEAGFMNSARVASGLMMGMIIVLSLSGCSRVHDADNDPPEMRLEDVKARSMELQHQVHDLMPQEDFEGNDLPGIEERSIHPISKCASYFDENYADQDVNAVYYSGSFSVSIDLDASAEEVAKETYDALVAELETATSVDAVNPNGGIYPAIRTTDNFRILVSWTEVDNSPRDAVSIDVTSPCFIPEGGTLPPGRKM